MTDNTITNKDSFTPLYLEAGRGLLQSQLFERGLAILLDCLARLGTVGLELTNTTAILENDEKRTAGQLIGLLKHVCFFSSDLEQTLVDGLRARNTLVHRFLVDHSEQLIDSSGRGALVGELHNLRTKIQHASQSIVELVKTLLKAAEGLDCKHDWLPDETANSGTMESPQMG